MASPKVAPQAGVLGGTTPLNQPTVDWKVGAVVTVKPRTWAGINRPGGRGRVTDVHLDEVSGQVSKVDVNYVLGGSDKLVDLHYVEPYLEDLNATLIRGRRQRRIPTEKDTEEKHISRKTKLHFDDDHGKKKICSRPENDEKAVNATSAPKKKKQSKKGLKRVETVKTSGADKDKGKVARPPVKRKLGGGGDANVAVPITTPDVPKVIVVDKKLPSPSPMASYSPLPEPRTRTSLEITRRRIKRSKEPVASTTPRKMSPVLQASPPKNNGLSIASPFKYRAATMPTVPRTPLSADKGLKRLAQTTPPVGAHPKPQIKFPPVAAGTPESKTKKLASPSSASLPRTNLQSEHERVMKEATQFIKEVVDSDKSSPNKKSNEQESTLPAAPKIDPNLLAKFYPVFQELCENCDGEGVEEEGLVGEINKYCNEGDHFESHQVQELVDHLCQENKVMRGDGQLYVI